MGRPDIQTGWGQRPDQFRVDRGMAKPEAVVARMLATSPRHPYIDPTKADKISVESLQINGSDWLFVDAIRASRVFQIDPKKISPDQLGAMVEKVKKDGEILAQGGIPQGVTPFSGVGERFAAMYHGQKKGNGWSDQDMIVFFARDEMQVGPNRKNLIVANTLCIRDELGQVLERFVGLGYGRRSMSNGKLNSGRR